jgi:hypothetical protein
MDTPMRFAGIVVLTAVLVVAALLLVPRLGGAPTPAVDPSWSVGSPAMPFDPGYWTPERMAQAKPAPMPTVP